MGAKKQRRHEVTVIVQTNKPIYRKDALYVAWNAIQDMEIFGGGKDDPREPFDHGKLKVKGRPTGYGW